MRSVRALLVVGLLAMAGGCGGRAESQQGPAEQPRSDPPPTNPLQCTGELAQGGHVDGGGHPQGDGEATTPEEAVDRADWVDGKSDGGQKARANRGANRRSVYFQKERSGATEAEMSRTSQGRRVSKLFVQNLGSAQRPAWYVTSYETCWDDFQANGGA